MTVSPQDASCFEPEATAILIDAIDQTCKALQIPSADNRGREVIAARIVDLARDGVLNAKALQQRVMEEARLRL